MLSKLPSESTVAGTRSVCKAVASGRATLVYVAGDADLFIKNKLKTLCDQHGVRLREEETMKALGQACGVPIGTAACALLKD